MPVFRVYVDDTRTKVKAFDVEADNPENAECVIQGKMERDELPEPVFVGDETELPYELRSELTERR